VILSAEEYLNLANPQTTGKSGVDDDAHRLHVLSQKRVATWQNTAKNQRNARLHAREERLKAEEEARVQQDILWAKEKQARKTELIGRAANMQLHQTEAVRKVNSKLLHENVLRERALQIQHRKKLAEDRKTIDSDYIVQAETIRERADEVQRQQDIAHRQAVMSVAEEQRKQSERVKQHKAQQRQLSLAETPVIRGLDTSYAEQMRQKLAENHRQQKELQAELIAAKEEALRHRMEASKNDGKSEALARKWRDRKDHQSSLLAENSKRKWA